MIAQQDLDQLLNRAKSKLVGVSQNELLAELYDVFTEFFNDSSIWWEVIKVDATPDSSTYTLTPSEGQIIRLTAVSTKDGFPWPAVMPVIPDLQLRNPPNEDTTLYAGVTMNVTLPNDKSNVPIAPSWVLPRWHTGILDGLLGKLMSIPNKSWTDKPLSGYHLKRFRDAIGRARVSALRSNTVGAQAWRFPQGAQTTTQQYGVPGFGGGERSF